MAMMTTWEQRGFDMSWGANHVDFDGGCAWRHHDDRRYWTVFRCAFNGFFDSNSATAVVDDFGNLVKVREVW